MRYDNNGADAADGGFVGADTMKRGDAWADAAVDDGMGMADAEDEDDDDNDGDDSGDGGGHGSSEAVPDGGMSFALSRSRILPLNTSRPLA